MSVSAESVGGCFRCHEACDVELTARSDRELVSGDRVELQFPHSWLLVSGPSYTRVLQTEDPSAAHFVSIESGGLACVWELEVTPQTLHFPEGQSRHGQRVTATLVSGTVPAGGLIRIAYRNTFSPYVAETETVWLSVGGEVPEVVPELTTLPREAEAIRVLAPSCALPGEAFPVLIVSLDRYENASCTRYTDEVLTLGDGRIVARDLTFAGSMRVPVVLPEEGVYRFRFGDVLSNAVNVNWEPEGPYWGDIHIHTKLSHDAQGTAPYEYARDVSGLDFAGVADHVQSLGEAGYDQVLSWAEAANRPGRFATILADERNPRQLTGHHNMYFRDTESFLLHRHIGRDAPALPDDTCAPDPSRVMLIPHHTGIHFGGIRAGQRGGAVDWDAWDDPSGMRPALEIYSHHGQSELYSPHHILSYEFNRMRNAERRGNSSVPGPHYAQAYWKRGLRLGVIGSSDEHSGQGGRRHGGIAAVWSPALSREDIFDSIRARRTYATTGERILLRFAIDDAEMGGVIRRSGGSRVHLQVGVWGTEQLVRVEVLRYRFGVDAEFVPILAELPHREAHGLDASYELEDEVEGKCMYYVRVVQEPLEWPGMAWSSPIWIEVE